MTRLELGDPGAVLVRCASHRARQHLFRIPGVDAHGFHSWQTAATGGFYLIPVARLDQALSIAGCTRAAKRFTYQRCIRTSGRTALVP